jgi:hypothetical protein
MKVSNAVGQPEDRRDRNTDRDYGDYRETDQPVQPSPAEQSGSTGRPTGNGDPAEQGADSGQGRYGQTGSGGAQPETTGQKTYRESETDGNSQTKNRSNAGSGTAEHEEDEYRRNEGSAPPQKEDMDTE